MEVVLITGGTGLVGGHLTKLLKHEGFAVRHLSRNPKPDAAVPTFAWDIGKGNVDPKALENVDHIIHLSGAGIADERWSEERLKVLYASRVDSGMLLLRALEKTGAWPKTFISASGINYYGAVTSEHVFTENDPPANDTVGKLTQAWEEAADAWAAHTRVVKLRTSVVLAREGGALTKLAAPARWGLSAPLGSGKQWMPWVHIDDLSAVYVHALRDREMNGSYNVAAPEAVQNRDFMRALAQVFHKPFFAPNVPGFAIRAILGEPANLILEGSRASNTKLAQSGFAFRFPKLGEALGDLLQ
ncbi:MAG: TIGR01777 family protein [Flavobacteriales bacterium]|nr:TIGR01777 family protein [Flavobacteriales bacterium]